MTGKISNIYWKIMESVTLLLLLLAPCYCSEDKEYLRHFTHDTAPTDHMSSERVGMYVENSPIYRHYLIPKDHYRCAKVCKCYNKTDDDVSIHAECSHHTIYYDPNFPPTLPSTVVELDLSKNNILHLQNDRFARYESLVKLTASNCRISTVNNSPCTLTSNFRYLDLSSNDITRLGSNALSCLTSLRTLLLQDNKLNTISSQIFAGLSAMKVLHLSKNMLRTIEPGAFEHCPNLRKLDLSSNKHLNVRKDFAQVFEPLKSLEILYIHGVVSSGYYPTKALLQLSSLMEVSLNGEKNDIFDQRLSQLRHLTKLTLTKSCYTKNFTNSYFEGVPYLQSIKIQNCPILSISPAVFGNNTLLQHVEIAFSRYTLKSALKLLCGIRNYKLKHLTLKRLRQETIFKPSVNLEGSDVVCLEQLETLNLDSNNIGFISSEFVMGLPPSLRLLSLKGNKIAVDNSLLYYAITVKDSFPQLVNLIEDYQGVARDAQVNDANYDYEVEFLAQDSRKAPMHVEFMNVEEKPVCDCQTELIFGKYNKSSALKEKRLIESKVKNYSASQSFGFGAGLFHGNFYHNISAIQFINLSSTLLTDWGERPLRLMPKEVEVADLSENKCEFFTRHFFQHNNSLLELHAQGNYIGPLLSWDNEGKLFSRLTKVQYLDLSRNFLYHLPWKLFNYQTDIKVLRLSSNLLLQLDLQLAHMKSLVYLDLKKNSLRDISERTRDDLDYLAKKFGLVTIDLRENPILCTCQGLRFLEWLRDTRVRVLNKDFLLCNNRQVHFEKLGDLYTRVQSLKRECVSKKILVLSCSFTAALLLFVCATVWIFANRWKIIYLRNLAISHFFGYNPDMECVNVNELPFKFDAFFVYNSASRNFVLDFALNELETKRGHRICVEDRDFLPGSFIPCNITSAVRSSRITVVVMDDSFKAEGWSHYAAEMAEVEAVRAKRDVLHLLLLESLPEERLPNVYLKAAKGGRISEMPPAQSDPDVVKVFWDTLSRNIGRCTQDRNYGLCHL